MEFMVESLTAVNRALYDTVMRHDLQEKYDAMLELKNCLIDCNLFNGRYIFVE